MTLLKEKQFKNEYRNLMILNSFTQNEMNTLFDECHTEVKEPSLPYYLPIAGGRIIGSSLSPRILKLYEMQTASSRIWTKVSVSISYDDNHYTTHKKTLYT